MRNLSKLFLTLLVSATVIGPACSRSDATVAHEKSVSESNVAASEARAAREGLRAARDDLARSTTAKSTDVGRNVGRVTSADASFVSRRDQVVAQARTSIAAMDQKIAELETYRKAGKVTDVVKSDDRIGKLREQRRVAGAALDDLASADPDNWDTRRVAVEKSFSDLDGVYKDARDTMSVKTSTESSSR